MILWILLTVATPYQTVLLCGQSRHEKLVTLLCKVGVPNKKKSTETENIICMHY